MRFKPLRALLLLILLIGAGSLLALAAYTANGRELVSLGYLDKTFLPQAVAEGETVLQSQEDRVYESAKTKLDALNKTYDFRLEAEGGTLSSSSSLDGLRYKNADTIAVGTGASFLLLAGDASLTFPAGCVVDATAGQPLASGGALQSQHRYVVAEQTLAQITITSDTAVLALDGSYSLTPSNSTDYNMLADAMKAMGLFKGSDTGYGLGYDLEKAPTRIQGLIMFLRLLGEEEAALSSSLPCTFADVPAWCQSYVSYAFEKGYTKGISSTEFGPSLEIRATEYMTFVLRALGYSDSGESVDFAWDTALAKALQTGVINAREHKQLTEQPFLRAQAVYVSYYALDARLKSTGGTLYASLIHSGALDKDAADSARKQVTTARMR